MPLEATEAEVDIYHLHLDAEPARQDLNVVLPMRRLEDLAQHGVIGTASPGHFSIMGYILDATELTEVTAPELAQALIDDQVDLVLLVPV